MQIKNDLLYVMLKSESGIKIIEEISQICKNSVQVSRFKLKLGVILAHFKEHNAQFKLC